MQCVKCPGKLAKVVVDHVEVDRCSGVWCDLGELKWLRTQQLDDRLRNAEDNNHGHDELRARCPRCGGDGHMVPMRSPEGLTLDTCSVCFGVWLDGGELERLTEAGWASRVRRWLKG